MSRKTPHSSPLQGTRVEKHHWNKATPSEKEKHMSETLVQPSLQGTFEVAN